MNNIQIAVIGCGHMGNLHIRKLSKMPDVDLLCVCDTDLCKNPTNRPHHRNFRDLLLYKPDAVVIATPTATHYAIAKFFLLSEIPVLVEKPMALNLEQAQELCAICYDKNLIMHVGMIERYNPDIWKFPPIEDVRAISCCRFNSPKPKRSENLHPVLDLMIHDIDFALRYLSYIPYSLCRPTHFGKFYMTEIEFDNGIVGVFSVTKEAEKDQRVIKIFAKEYDPITFDLVKGNPDVDKLEFELRTFIDAVRGKKVWEHAATCYNSLESLKTTLATMDALKK